MNKIAILAVGLTVIGALLSACSSSDDDTPTATATRPAAPTAEETTAAAVPTSTPTVGDPSAAAFVEYPRNSTATGVEVVDRFVRAVEIASVLQLREMLVFTSLPCAVSEGTAGRQTPVCPDGVTAGTAVPSLYEARCEGGWLMEYPQLLDTLARYAGPRPGLVAVAKLAAAPAPPAEGGRPPGEYFVVFQPGGGFDPELRAAIVSESGVTALYQGCGGNIEDMLAGKVADMPLDGFVLPPVPAR